MREIKCSRKKSKMFWIAFTYADILMVMGHIVIKTNRFCKRVRDGVKTTKQNSTKKEGIGNE